MQKQSLSQLFGEFLTFLQFVFMSFHLAVVVDSFCDFSLAAGEQIVFSGLLASLSIFDCLFSGHCLSTFFSILVRI